MAKTAFNVTVQAADGTERRAVIEARDEQQLYAEAGPHFQSRGEKILRVERASVQPAHQTSEAPSSSAEAQPPEHASPEAWDGQVSDLRQLIIEQRETNELLRSLPGTFSGKLPSRKGVTLDVAVGVALGVVVGVPIVATIIGVAVLMFGSAVGGAMASIDRAQQAEQAQFEAEQQAAQDAELAAYKAAYDPVWQDGDAMLKALSDAEETVLFDTSANFRDRQAARRVIRDTLPQMQMFLSIRETHLLEIENTLWQEWERARIADAWWRVNQSAGIIE